MADVLFKNYASGLPAAAVPPARTDTLLLIQGGEVVLLQIASLVAAAPLYKDASSAPVTVDLAAYTDITVIKTDATANAVTLLDTSGKTVMGESSQTITGQREAWHMVLNGNDWYRLS